MEKNTHKEQLTRAIKERINEAPHDWAKIIAERMGKSVESVYAYCRYDRGIKRKYPREVLRHLNQIIEQDKKETQIILKQ